MSLLRLGKCRVIGGITVIVVGGGLWLASSAQADSGPPTPNPLVANPNPMISQLSPQVQALLQLGAVPVPGVNITGLGQAAAIHGDSVVGEGKFAADCMVCHGPQGTGGVPNPGSDDGTVPVLNPVDPAFIADANGDAAIFARDIDVFIQHGSRPSGKSPLLSMPAWGDHALLSQSDIADIEAYVMALNAVFWPDRCPGIRLDVANPSPGARVVPGKFVIQGTAMDVRARQGSGIDHIDFFLEDRDAGGRFVGTSNPSQSPGSEGPSTFLATISLPKSTGAHMLFAFAFSTVSSNQAVVSVPVAIGEDSSKAFATPPTAQTVSCVP